MDPKLQSDTLVKIDLGVRRGVARALAEHKKADRSIVVMQEGKIIQIAAEDIEIPAEFKDEFKDEF